jgi:nucleoside-diphosphate-sugar epimerase
MASFTEKLDMNKVVVTGSEGFIGRALKHLWKDSRTILSIDREGFPVCKVDLADEVTWPLLDGGVHDLSRIRAVVNLAARTSVVVPAGEELAVLKNNINVTRSAIRECYCAGIPLMINLSSSSVYGRSSVPFVEGRAVKPISTYGSSKEHSEAYLSEVAEDFKVRCLSIRLFNAIGRFQRKNMLPWYIMESMYQGREIPVYGHILRSWTPVDQLAQFMSWVIDNPESVPVGHTVVNFGLRRPRLQTEMFASFEKAARQRDPRVRVKWRLADKRPFEMEATLPSMEKFASLFPRELMPTEDGFDRAVEDVVETYRSQFA